MDVSQTSLSSPPSPTARASSTAEPTPAQPSSSAAASALSASLRDLSLRQRPTGAPAGTPAPRAALPGASGSHRGMAAKRAGAALVRTLRDKLAEWRPIDAEASVVHGGAGDWTIRTRMEIIEASPALFLHRASLPRAEAIRMISDSELEKIYDGVISYVHPEMARLLTTAYSGHLARFNESLANLWGHLPTIRESGRQLPEEEVAALRAGADSLSVHRAPFVEYWGAQATAAAHLLDIDATLGTNLPYLPAGASAGYEANRRIDAVVAFSSRLNVMRAIADSETIHLAVASLCLGDSAAGKLYGENGLLTLMETFNSDIFHAYQSVRDELLAWRARAPREPLAESACIVLDGFIARLTEFAAALEESLATHRNDPDFATLPLAASVPLIELSWMVANDALRLVELSREPQPAPAPDARAVPAALALDASAAASPSASQPARAGKGKGKGKGKVKGSKAKSKPGRGGPASQNESESIETLETLETRDGGQQRERPGPLASREPCAVPGAAHPQGRPEAPRAEGLARTALGTYILLNSEQAPTAASAAADSSAASPPDRGEIADRLARLDALLAFDLPAEQRKVSQARWQLSPENAAYVTENVIERLANEARAMRDCLNVLDVPRQRWGLSGAEADDLHRKIEQLRPLQAQAEGLARSLRARLPGDTIEHMKRYPFPIQDHVEHLVAERALAPAAATPLSGEPGTLFELRLQPSALRNGTLPRPMWLHIHTQRAVHARELATLPDTLFAAAHVKSDEQRGYNREWQDARARQGHEKVVVHRGKIAPALCRQLLARTTASERI
mgnify:CR=1 FL=1